MMSLANGNPRQVISDQKYYLDPKFVLGEILVVEANPSYDANQVEYWGVNISTGQRLWQYALNGQGNLNYHDARTTSSGSLFVIQCREDPNDCSWANVDPKTGVGSNSGSATGGGYVENAWYKDTVYFGNEGELMVINTLDGQRLYQWP